MKKSVKVSVIGIRDSTGYIITNKSCLDCKYGKQSEYSEPCVYCGVGHEAYNRWEPEEHDE